MFGSLGGPELLLILVIALIVFGPRKLPEIGKSVGKMLMEFRKASTDFRRTIEDEVESEKVHEAPRPPAALAPAEPPAGAVSHTPGPAGPSPEAAAATTEAPAPIEPK